MEGFRFLCWRAVTSSMTELLWIEPHKLDHRCFWSMILSCTLERSNIPTVQPRYEDLLDLNLLTAVEEEF